MSGWPTDQELLERHAPMLKFDSLEAFRPTKVDGYLGESELLDGDSSLGTGVPLSDANGPTFRLDPLPELGRREGQERTAALLPKSLRDLDQAGSCYGRVEKPAAEEVAYLQYWFFYVDNPCVLEVGRHDGDWEFAQVRVELSGATTSITHLTLNQHGGPETRKFEGSTQRPDVYVAVNSHASYFDRSTHLRLPIADECDGDRSPQAAPEVVLMPGANEVWPRWKGRWGMDRGPGTWLDVKLGGAVPAWLVRRLNRIPAGDSPASPECQASSWDAAGCWKRGTRHRRAWLPYRLAVHFLGKLTWPRAAPDVSVRSTRKTQVEIHTKASGLFLRRIARVAVMLEDRDTHLPVATRSIRHGWTETVDVSDADKIDWRSAGYNRLRQRGEVTDPRGVQGAC